MKLTRFIFCILLAGSALAAFVPDASKTESVITDTERRIGRSRWYPVEGGNRVLIPYERGEYDSARFSIEPRAWDHEHRDACGEHIPAMTFCYATEPEQSYILLCAGCFERHVAPKQQK